MNNTHPTVWQGILNTKQNNKNPESEVKFFRKTPKYMLFVHK